MTAAEKLAKTIRDKSKDPDLATFEASRALRPNIGINPAYKETSR